MLRKQICAVTSHGRFRLGQANKDCALCSVSSRCHWDGDQTEENELQVLRVQG